MIVKKFFIKAIRHYAYLVQILQDRIWPLLSLRKLEDVTDHGELHLAVAAGELLLPDLGAHRHRTFAFSYYFDKYCISHLKSHTAGHITVLNIPEDSKG